jgi:uncharacterized protein (DUF362 family)
VRRALLLAVFLFGCPREKTDAPAPAGTGTGTGTGIADAITHASPLYEDAGAISIAGKVDGAALRAKNRARLAKDRSAVTVLRGDDPRTLGERICEAVVPKRAASTPILLKPNLGGFDWFKDPSKNNGDDGVKGRITQPEFVRGVIQCLKKRGHTKITVAEGWGATHKDWLKLVDVSGYAAMTKDEGVPLVAMDDDGVFDKAEGEPGKPLAVTGMEKTHVPTLLMPKLLAEHLEHGLFISIPRVKAHRFGVVSLSVKGMQGTVMLSDASPAFRQKWRMHRELNAWLDGRKKGEDDRDLYVSALETFAERIADVLEIEAPHVVLADASPAMGGDGFQKLQPTDEKLAIGGTNPILVDQVGARVLGLWDNAALAKELKGHKTSPLITAAAKRFGVDLKDVAVEGDGASVLDAPRPVHFVGMAPFQIHSGATAVEPPPPSSTLPIAHAAPLGAAKIAIDGDPSDPAWARATKATWTTDYAGEETGIRTSVRFVWSEGALFALFELEGAGLNTDTTKPIEVEREKLWSEDCVEIFLDTTLGSPKSYHEIEVGPFGHFLDLVVDGTKNDVAWSSGTKIGTTRKKDHATIEVMITAKEIVSAFKPNARFPLGLFRMEGKGERKYLAWSPPKTKKPNFHVPEAFGALVLDAP